MPGPAACVLFGASAPGDGSATPVQTAPRRRPFLPLDKPCKRKKSCGPPRCPVFRKLSGLGDNPADWIQENRTWFFSKS